MITRIVRLTLKADVNQEAFEAINRDRNPFRNGVKGCREVKVMKDVNNENILYTMSIWDRNEDLEAYRESAYFAETWPMVKALLDEKALAFSMTEIDSNL